MDLFRTVSKINGDFGQKSQIFSNPVYFAPCLKAFHLELGIGAWSQKTSHGATGPNKKFHDIFSRVETMHQRDRQTDGQTPGDSKDRAYA